MMESYLKKLQFGILTAGCLAGLQQVQAAGVTAFYVRKANAYQQTSAAAPAPIAFAPAYFIARANGDATSTSGTTVSTPSQFFPSFPLDDKGDHVEFAFPADLQQIDSFMPPGSYSFTFPDNTVAPLNFSTGTFPTPIPQISNYAAAQNVDSTGAFTVNFNAFTGAGANDAIELEVRNSDDTIAFLKSVTTGTSISIPANTLSSGESFTANLRFVHNVDSNTSSVPGVTGTAGYANDTQFAISTGGDGGGGGGDDTDPPLLVFTNPFNGQTGVTLNSPVSFIFSEAMTKQQLILWTGVDASKFGYSWSGDGTTLTATYSGGFPANATITYNLQPGATGFKDLAGNALTTPAQGSFTTGTGGGGTGVDPCRTGTNNASGGSSGSIFKALEFVQTSNSAPVPDTENPAAAFATYNPTNQTVNSVKVTGPNNINITLDKLPFGGLYTAFQDFPSAAALDAAFPAGNYTITASPAGSGVVTVQAAAAMPVPTFQNLTQLQSFDPTKDFVLNFSPFTGASGQFDSIQIDIEANGSTRHFYAPDYCLNRTLPNTATSVTIPANTFQTGDKLSGSISFSHFSVNANAIPNTTLSAGATVTTKFDFTGGSTGSNVKWNTPVVNADGTVTFTASAPVGTTVSIEKSTDLKTWTPVTTVTSVNGTITYTFDPKTGGRYTFFRGKVQ